jgi:hypothetical protein
LVKDCGRTLGPQPDVRYTHRRTAGGEGRGWSVALTISSSASISSSGSPVTPVYTPSSVKSTAMVFLPIDKSRRLEEVDTAR